MGFSVEPDAVAGLSKQFDRLAEHATQGRSYVANHTDLDLTGEGLINLIAGGHQQVQDQVEQFLKSLADPTATSTAGALDAAAKYYRATDDANARELDATYPCVDVGAAKVGTERVEANVGAFQEVADPTARYQPPQDYNEEMPYEPHWSDLASPTSLVRDAIWNVTGAAASLGICDRAYDPFEVFLKPVVGDWAGMRGCADVFRNVSAAVTEMADNTRWYAQSLPGAWTGNAADSCQVHLFVLAKSLESARQPLEDIAKEYEGAAVGAQKLSSSIGVLLSDIADAALAAAASAAVSGAGATGVGLPIALVIGAFTLTRIYKVVRGVMQLLDLIARIRATVDAFRGAAGDFGKVDATTPLPKLPANSMTLPSV
ncbi:hypothetical protein [Haloechinothrix salitolerans]|uniref:Excreted virulence factor EspC, type VII ESX diderm n=1 Tax=Haloechinothrix salitolerans TaxID=926830 RepID=A0ABW2BR67_9PSEU